MNPAAGVVPSQRIGVRIRSSGFGPGHPDLLAVVHERHARPGQEQVGGHAERRRRRP